MPQRSVEFQTPNLRKAASDGRLNTGSSKRSERSESSTYTRSARSSSFTSGGTLLTQPLFAGGGRTQGAVISPHRRGQNGLDVAQAAYHPSVHGWHLPEGAAQSQHLASEKRLHDGAAIPGTWTWMIHKARNHIGAGNKGVLGKGDLCSTMVSGDTPEWFVGLRTVHGPFSCNAVPVRRCPKNYIDGKKFSVRAQSYKQGDCLDITNQVEDTSRIPSPALSRCGKEPHWKKDFCGYQVNGRAAQKPSDLVGGGCQIRAGPALSCKVVTHERFDPGNAVRAGKKFCDR